MRKFFHAKDRDKYLMAILLLAVGIIFLYQSISKNSSGSHDQSSNNMAMSGDTNLRYSVSFNHPDTVVPNANARLSFPVYNAANGNPVSLFSQLYTKPMHMIVVNSDLSYYAHIHPQLRNGVFVIDTKFPKADVYHIYLDFQPIGAREQQFAFTLPVGKVGSTKELTLSPDTNLTKTFGDDQVTLKYSKPLEAVKLSRGEQLLTFTLQDAKSKKPIKTLKPYLGAFGHLVLINTKTFDYIHVHPTAINPPKVDDNGGPTVSFIPMSLYGPIKPGVYRVFAQFNPDNKLFTADFTIKVE